jgi:hypothetical protein
MLRWRAPIRDRDEAGLCAAVGTAKLACGPGVDLDRCLPMSVGGIRVSFDKESGRTKFNTVPLRWPR